MPERQRDGGVVTVPHRAACINARIAAHDAPTPADRIWIALDDATIFVRREAVRIPVAHVNRFTAAAEDFFDEVRLAAATTKRFVAENEFFIHRERGSRHEEPFALTAKGSVLTGVTLAGRDVIARERITDVFGLERVHRLADAGSTAGHGSDEPFAFVVSAEEAICLRLFALLADEQEQMSLLRFGLDDGNIQRVAR